MLYFFSITCQNEGMLGALLWEARGYGFRQMGIYMSVKDWGFWGREHRQLSNGHAPYPL